MGNLQENPPGSANSQTPLPDIAVEGVLSYRAGEFSTDDIETQTVPSDVASNIRDGGDTRQLIAQGSKRENHDRDSVSLQGSDRTDKDEVISHTGGRFLDLANHPSDLEINDTNPDTNTESGTLARPSLEKQLRDAIISSAWLPIQKKKFLPLDKLDDIIKLQSVEGVVRSWGIENKADVDYFTKAIVNRHTLLERDGSADDGKFCLTSRRRLFAILIMVGKAESIRDFVSEFIFDRHLPFTVDQEHKTMKVRCNRGRELANVLAFSSWSDRDLDLFDLYQWQLLAPYFALSSKDEPKIHTYTLEGMKPLPFVMDPTLKEDEDKGLAVGGFGEVRRVMIHKGHTNWPIKYVAIKTLMNGSKKAFDQEVGALKRIMQENANPHVTRLLVAIEHGTNMSLMFPWAEGNLLQYWERTSPGAGDEDGSWTRWMAKQFAGLASVIELVHGPTKLNHRHHGHHSQDSFTSSSRSLLPPRTEYGRHGDLKPENILLFRGAEHDDDSDINASGGPVGILKVADFGLAAFHTRNSEKVKASQTGRSKTHRAPEYDGTEVTASADLWSFGCILLEFLVWYQHGINGVKKFSTARSDEERGKGDLNEDYTEDKFFMRCPGTEHPFKVKNAVSRMIESLRQGSKCGPFCNEVLDLIESGLLQVDSKKRFLCLQVHARLREILRKATESTEYCIRPAELSHESSTLADADSLHHPAGSSAPLSTSTHGALQEAQLIATQTIDDAVEVKAGDKQVQDMSKAVRTNSKKRGRDDQEGEQGQRQWHSKKAR